MLLCSCLKTQAQAYSVNLVSNLNLGGESNPRWLTVWDTTLYFMGNDGINGHKLFSMTPSTLPALCSNVGGSSVYGDGTISTNRPMGLLNNKLYFPEFVNGTGRELYAYDGVNTPTLIMDMNPGTGSSAPNYLMTFNNKLYFQASSPTLGNELWVHDPLANTTTCLTDINPGTASSTIAFITAYNNKLYFAGSNGNDTTTGNTGVELYAYDPATNTTALVADINPGYLPSNPTALMVANSKLYFVAGETQYGRELYEFNGSSVTRLTDINPGPAQGVYTSDHSFPVWFNGKIYLAANDNANLINLGVFDPSTNAVNIEYCSGPAFSGNPRYFTVWDNTLFFTNLDSAHGYELWTANGLTAPALAFDIRPGTGSSLPKFFTEFAGSLYFNASNDTSTQEELFRLRKVDIGEPSGLSNQRKAAQLSLFPNPAHGRVYLDTKESAAVHYKLYSITGHCIAEGISAADHSIPLQHIAPGVYLYRLSTARGQQIAQGKLSVY